MDISFIGAVISRKQFSVEIWLLVFRLPTTLETHKSSKRITCLLYQESMQNQAIRNTHQDGGVILEEGEAGPEQYKEHFGLSGSEPKL